jgi:NagD protein
VLTGSTRRDGVNRFPFRPGRVLDSIADAIELV